MDGIQLIVGCVALTFLSFGTVCCENCCYQYHQQPSKANCSPEAPLPLELRCQVTACDTGTDNFTIQWRYSNSSSPPSQHNSTSMETILKTGKAHVIEIEVIHNTSSKVSMLRLTNYSEMASGHYWCTVLLYVNAIQPAHETLNPSQVVNINICPFTENKIDGQEMEVCTMQVNLFETPMTNRCADDLESVGIIEKVQLGSTEMCTIEGLEKSTTTDEVFPNPDVSPSNEFPMHFVWMIVGIAFAVLIAIIIMPIAIIYLNHKKNKIRVQMPMHVYKLA